MCQNKEIILSTRVRCCGQLHRIGINQKGQIVLFGHPTRADRKAAEFARYSGQHVRCLQLRENWKDLHKRITSCRTRGYGKKEQVLFDFPCDFTDKKIRQEIYKHKEIFICRRNQKDFWDEEEAKTPAITKLKKRLTWRREEQFYEIAQKAGFHSHESCASYLPKTKSLTWWPPGLGKLETCPNWHKEVYQRGLAVVGGYLVYDLLSDAGPLLDAKPGACWVAGAKRIDPKDSARFSWPQTRLAALLVEPEEASWIIRREASWIIRREVNRDTI